MESNGAPSRQAVLIPSLDIKTSQKNNLVEYWLSILFVTVFYWVEAAKYTELAQRQR
jgi:hypothetical protein